MKHPNKTLNIRISYQDVALRSMERSDIVMVMEWRNQERVRNKLINNELLTIKDQLNWYKNLNPESEMYFIVEQKSIPLGLIYASNINNDERSFEGNIFIGDPINCDSRTVLKAVIMLSDFFFNELNFVKAYSKVRRDNAGALSIDKAFGYSVINETDDVLHLEVSKSTYNIKADLLKKRLFNQNGVDFHYNSNL